MRLKEARESKGITQTTLSQITGINSAVLSQAETGQQPLSLENSIIVENALGCEVDWGDKFTHEEKEEIFEAMEALAEKYPLLQVLDSAKAILSKKATGGEQANVLRFYQEQACKESLENLLLPPDIQQKLNRETR